MTRMDGPMHRSGLLKGKVMGVQVAAVGWDEVVERIIRLAKRRVPGTVYLFNVHSAVTQLADHAFRRALNGGTLVLPDGAPISWVLRRQGFQGQPRIGGPDLMWRLCEAACQEGIAIALYGGEETVVGELTERLRASFPGLRVAERISPPFRPLTQEEDAEMVRRLNESGEGLVFVALGCPKQEKWMAEHADRVNAVLLGVGAAFDFHAGRIARAPVWMQRLGMEWLARLLADPRRLWRRYLVTNTVFILWVLVAWPRWLFDRVLETFTDAGSR